MLKNADEDARLEEPLDIVVVITSLRSLMLRSNHFAGDFKRPLEVFEKNVRVRANVTRVHREWGTDVDWKMHLAFKHETRQRDTR